MGNRKLSLVLAALALFGCGDDTPAADVGQATAALTLAPKDARCIVIATTGTTTVTKQFNVSPSGNAVFNLTGLPVGSATMTAQAYGVQCSSITGQQPTYVSDAQSVTISAATPIMVTFQMRPNGTLGGGSVSVNFPNPHGTVTEFPVTIPTPSSIT